MTPLDFAEGVRRALCPLLGLADDACWAQYAQPVVTCESLVVGITADRTEPLFAEGQACGFIEIIDLTVVVARECEVQFDQSGQTILGSATEVARIMGDDVAVLTQLRNEMIQAAELGRVQSAFAWQNEGGLALTILQLSNITISHLEPA